MKAYTVKRFLTAAFAVIVCMSVFVGCDKDNEDCLDIEPICTVTDSGETLLEWGDKYGSDYFNLYRATSKYGKYEIVARRLKKGKYLDSHRFGWYKLGFVNKNGVERIGAPFGEEGQLFGNNVYVFSPQDNPNTVKALIGGIYSEQEKNHFGSERYAFLYKPGVYDNGIELKTGFFTTHSGLGLVPDDVSVQTVSCSAEWNYNVALINFWRGAENFSTRSGVLWAVSQGCYLRNVNIAGNLVLHHNGGFASGGFLADSIVSGNVESGSQQQWFSRNCAWRSWRGGVWNMCFASLENGCAPSGEWASEPYTNIESLEISKEKPMLVFDKENGYRICVPPVRKNAVGVTSISDNARFIPQSDIYFAKASLDTADTLNAALHNGKHVVFTPGVYTLDKAITVHRADTVLLGLGMATLIPANGNACIESANADGITVAGLLFDTGGVKSETLLKVGVPGDEATRADNPPVVQDCFFRVGGAADGLTRTETCLEIFTNETVCENIWLWRADHGDGVGWNVNVADTGMKVYGNNVKAYGLFAEHFRKHNVEWLGENGKIVFYQSEIAYDVPDAQSWTQPDGTLGYASIKVDGSVNDFTACALGIYSNFHNDGIVLGSAISVPDIGGIKIENACTVALSAKGEISNIVNLSGGAVNSSENIKKLVMYQGGLGNG